MTQFLDTKKGKNMKMGIKSVKKHSRSGAPMNNKKGNHNRFYAAQYDGSKANFKLVSPSKTAKYSN